MAYRFKFITACGTFDRFHQGHQAFLKRAFELSRKVLIGITSDEFVKSKQYPHLIEPFSTRKERVVAFLTKNQLSHRAELFPLNDVYGPTLKKDSQIEAILVTEKSQNGAELINQKRKSLQLTPLTIIAVDLIKTTDGQILSSTRLRKNLILPETLRASLQKPMGKLFKGNENDLRIAVLPAKGVIEVHKPPMIITVGDVVTKSFNEGRMPITLAIVDFRIKRQETIKNLSELGFTREEPDVIVENPPGRITWALSKAVERTIQQCNNRNNFNHEPFIIRVLGEEDLAVLPAIIYAPEGTFIFYGQPNEGIVMVEVNENIKIQAHQLLEKFITK